MSGAIWMSLFLGSTSRIEDPCGRKQATPGIGQPGARGERGPRSYARSKIAAERLGLKI